MMLNHVLVVGVLSMVSETIAQVVDNQPAFVAWSAVDANDQECTGTQIYTNYDATVGTCYTIDQEGAYTAQLVSSDFATITFFSDEYCQNDAAAAVEANSETCTLAGYGSTSEYSIMLESTDMRKRSLMKADIKRNGVTFDPEWENIRQMLKNGTFDKTTQSSNRRLSRKSIEASRAPAPEKRAPVSEKEITKRDETVAIPKRTATSENAPTRVEIAPRSITTIHYMKCPGSIGGFSKLAGCVNAGAHCDDNGNFITGTFGQYGSCNAFCSCYSYLYHDGLKKSRAAQ